MYIPTKFETGDDGTIEVLQRGGLAHLITPGVDGLAVTPIPMLYRPDAGTLLGHVARANPHWRAVRPDVESVAMFTGPQAYISPSFYPTKAQTGKVVPTWNYEIVCIYGQLHVRDDEDWLRTQITALTDAHEDPRADPWTVGDAPAAFIDAQLSAIVGLELTITRWEGKAKMSQNQPSNNQHGVVEGLEASPVPTDHVVAERVRGLTT